jgi:uncharacterized protein (DUF427 family)
MKAIWKDAVIADSNDLIVIEGNSYFPPHSVHTEYLRPSTHTTTCPWKGEAHYYDVVVSEDVNTNAAWYYPIPKDGALERVGQDFANYIAFWKEVVVMSEV